MEAAHTSTETPGIAADLPHAPEKRTGLRGVIDRVAHSTAWATVLDQAKRNAGMLAGPVVAAVATEAIGPEAGIVLGFITANAGHFAANYKLFKEGAVGAERLDKVIDQVSVLTSEVESLRQGRQGDDPAKPSRQAPIASISN